MRRKIIYVKAILKNQFFIGNFGNSKSFLSFAAHMVSFIDHKAKILKKACDLFMQHGTRSVSMDDIAGSLGYSKKTLYHHFENKDALVEEVVNEILESKSYNCEVGLKHAQNVIHEIFLMIEEMRELFRRLDIPMIYDLEKYYPNAYKRFAKFKTEFLYDTTRDNLVRGIKEGVFREDIDVDIITKYNVESILMAFSPEFNENLKANPMEIHEQLLYYSLFGMATLKGYKLIVKYQHKLLNKSLDAKK